MARMTHAKRARRYLQASMESGYTGLPAEHREAKRQLMREHERAYPKVRQHALAGTSRDFDLPLNAGEREHQRHLREQEGLTEQDVRQIRDQLRTPSSAAQTAAEPDTGIGAGPKAARSAASAGTGAIGSALSGKGSIWLQIVGMFVLLSLIYLLLSEKGKTNGVKALQGIAGAVTGAVRTFLAPVDPIAAAESALGAQPINTSSSTGSSTAGGAATPSDVKGYVKPFTGAKAERVDQGQDFALKPGAAIRAIGDAKVTAVLPNWYKGQPLVAYDLLSGPAKGRTVYVAEQISPLVHKGQRVRAGQLIGRYAPHGTGLETGWAKPSGQTLAQATTGYTEGQATPAGTSFSSFLAALGVPTS